MKVKYKGKFYSVENSKCLKRPCFLPFSGNGQDICRFYELGQCKSGLPESEIKRGKK